MRTNLRTAHRSATAATADGPAAEPGSVRKSREGTGATTPVDGRETLTRRRLLRTALAVGTAAPLGLTGPARASSGAPAPARLTLPAPTGPYPVGTVALHLVDTARPDPVAGPGRHRELMAGVWYPARDVERYPPAPWMSAGALRELLASAGFPADAVQVPLTAGHQGAPARWCGRELPVVVFSHGAHSHRADHTVIVQELASHGYAVVTVDHTYDAFTEFPDGRVLAPLRDPQHALGPADFAADIRFVLDRVDDLAAGRDPDAGRRPLPAGLAGAIDPRRTGMFGWSKGGTATARVMLDDPRVRAGLSLDGPMLPAVTGDLDRPFMMMTAEFTRAREPGVAEFWTHLRGWRLDVRAEGAVHASYGDNQVLIPQLAEAVGMSDEELRDRIGTLAPDRAVRIQQAYPLAFFDLHLRHRRGHLLDGPSRAFPEVTFLP
ncbi:alpha/beta hydrolase family protein [Streptomyces echinatus]|uniref:alpha/beta hydrolase family protein n=1 Tax=Streptomyces echinatus TaxID=67293 RepID=UPI0037AA76A0